MDSTGRSFHLFQMMVISNTSTSLKNHILSENFVSKDHVNPVVIIQRDKLMLIILYEDFTSSAGDNFAEARRQPSTAKRQGRDASGCSQ